MESAAIAAIVAAALSLALELVPGLNTVWDRLGVEAKSLVVFLLSLLLPVAFVGAACGGLDFGIGATCPDPTNAQMWLDAVLLGFAAYSSSQVTFKFVSAPLGARMNGVG